MTLPIQQHVSTDFSSVGNGTRKCDVSSATASKELESWAKSLNEISRELTQFESCSHSLVNGNTTRRILYRKLDRVLRDAESLITLSELKRIDATSPCDQTDIPDNVALKHLCITAYELEKRLIIQPSRRSVPRNSRILSSLLNGLDTLDLLCRGICACSLIMVLGMTVAVPLVMLTEIESYLVIGGYASRSLKRPSIAIKQWIARWLLAVFGVTVIKEQGNIDYVLKQKEPMLIMFTHASNLDPFIMLSTHPSGFRAIVKRSLFAMPYIGWLALAFGCVPIDRSKRESAAASMTSAGLECERVGYSLAVSPEGTRSRTGHLRPFKKGAFHLAQQLNWPLLPLSIHGAYALWPPGGLKSGHFFCRPGYVGIRYHSLISISNEDKDGSPQLKNDDGKDEKFRHSASVELRNVFFDALENPPKNIEGNVGIFHMVRTYIVVGGTFYLLAKTLMLSASALTNILGYTATQASFISISYTACVTAANYYGSCSRSRHLRPAH